MTQARAQPKSSEANSQCTRPQILSLQTRLSLGARMPEAYFVRPSLSFEREFGQHRNWWVRDPRICGNPLSIYLFLLSHEAGRKVTQTEARNALGLGERAWVTGKKALLEAGFLLEVRDRFPDDHERGRQRRFRLFLQDPEQDVVRDLRDAVIELEEPYEAWLNKANPFVSAKRREGDSPESAKRRVEENPQVSPSLQTAGSEPSTLQNAGSLEEEKTKPSWLVGSIADSNQPTNHAAGVREAEINAGIAALHPDLRLTFAQIAREVNGRVDLDLVDVVRAVEDTVIRAAQRGDRVADPARYVGSVIVRNSQNYRLGAAQPEAFAPIASSALGSTPAADCLSGNHWWGPETWAEIDRSHCVQCGHARRIDDATFAELEADMNSLGSVH